MSATPRRPLVPANSRSTPPIILHFRPVHADIFRRIESSHFQEFDRTCALPGTAFHALFILQSLQANMSVSKSNSHHSSNRRSVTLHMPARRAPPHSFLLSIRKLPDFCLARLHTNQPDTRDGPHLNHGDVSSPSKPLSIACEFLKPVSYRSLGTLSFIVSCRTSGPNPQ